MEFSGTVIKNKTFEKNFRGYDKDEVDQFLDQLSTAYDQLLRENAYLRERAEKSEKESQQLKEVEASLYRTLKTAEDTGASIIEEANEAAEEILKDANENSDKLINESKELARQIINEAEITAKNSFNSLKKNAISFIQGYQNVIQKRLEILGGLKNLHDGLETYLKSTEKEVKSFDNEGHHLLISELETSFGLAISDIKEGERKSNPTIKLNPEPEIPLKNESIDEYDDLTIDELNKLAEENELNQIEGEIEVNTLEDFKSEIDEVNIKIEEEDAEFDNENKNFENANPGDSVTWKTEIHTSEEEENEKEENKKRSFFDELD